MADAPEKWVRHACGAGSIFAVNTHAVWTFGLLPCLSLVLSDILLSVQDKAGFTQTNRFLL